MAKHDDLLNQGARDAPEAETAEEKAQSQQETKFVIHQFRLSLVWHIFWSETNVLQDSLGVRAVSELEEGYPGKSFSF